MKTESIPKIITLFAGLVVCIVTIIRGVDTTTSLEILLATLIAFYIIGIIAKKLIERVISGNSVIKKDNEDIVDENEQNGDNNIHSSTEQEKEE